MRDMCLGVYGVKQIGMDGTLISRYHIDKQARLKNDIARQLHVADSR